MARADVVRGIFRGLLAAFFVGAGVMHFVAHGYFVQVVPAALPAHDALVYISGVAEIAGGLGVLLPATRRLAGWGLIVLLVAVFPANIYVAVSNVQLTDLPSWMAQPSAAARWGRLPLQLVFLAWVWWTTLRKPRTVAQ